MDSLYLLLFAEDQKNIELGELIAESNDIKFFKSVNYSNGNGYGYSNGNGYGNGYGYGNGNSYGNGYCDSNF